jgi:cell wall-associated NlpC family hydrolase
VNYRAVGNRCAVNLEDLDLPVSNERALEILQDIGFKLIPFTNVSMIEMVRQYIGIAKYRRGAAITEAPGVFDCSTLTKWAYGQRGIWIPRHSIAQRDYYDSVVTPTELTQAADLAFTTGFRNYYWGNDPTYGVGHVGLITERNTVIHAANSKTGLAEVDLKNFTKVSRGVRRLVEDDSKVITLQSPPHRIVEESKEFRWIILQRC